MTSRCIKKCIIDKYLVIYISNIIYKLTIRYMLFTCSVGRGGASSVTGNNILLASKENISRLVWSRLIRL